MHINPIIQTEHEIKNNFSEIKSVVIQKSHPYFDENYLEFFIGYLFFFEILILIVVYLLLIKWCFSRAE